MDMLHKTCLINSTSLKKTRYYRKTYARRLENGLGGGQTFQPPLLMPTINLSGHNQPPRKINLWNNRLLKSINRGGHYKKPASKNTLIFGGGPLIMPTSINILEAQLTQARLDSDSEYKYRRLGFQIHFSLSLPLE